MTLIPVEEIGEILYKIITVQQHIVAIYKLIIISWEETHADKLKFLS